MCASISQPPEGGEPYWETPIATIAVIQRQCESLMRACGYDPDSLQCDHEDGYLRITCTTLKKPRTTRTLATVPNHETFTMEWRSFRLPYEARFGLAISQTSANQLADRIHDLLLHEKKSAEGIKEKLQSIIKKMRDLVTDIYLKYMEDQCSPPPHA